MSEATEVPMVCMDCGGTLTDDDAIWSPGIGVLTHINYSQCIASLNERLTAATKRAEAAEARRREIDDEAFDYAEQIEALRAERDALRVECEAVREQRDYWAIAAHKLADARKVDDAMVERAWKYLEIIAIEKSYGMLSGIDKEYLRNALTAALAVQPTTSTGDPK